MGGQPPWAVQSCRSSMPVDGFALRSKFRFLGGAALQCCAKRCKLKAAFAGGERPAVSSPAAQLDEFSLAASLVREGSSLTAFFGAGFFAASARFRS